MSNTTQPVLGSVVSLWGFVKSMMGEELNASEVTPRGLLGIVPMPSWMVSMARSQAPRIPGSGRSCSTSAWSLSMPRAPTRKYSRVRITLPDGTIINPEGGDSNPILSKVLHRDVTLTAAERGREEVERPFPIPPPPVLSRYWPDMEGLDYRDTVTYFALPGGTFFDCAAVHVLTTATIDRLGELYPQGRFEVRRFGRISWWNQSAT